MGKKKGTKLALGEFLGPNHQAESAVLPNGPRQRAEGDDGSFVRPQRRPRAGEEGYEPSRSEADDTWRRPGGGFGQPGPPPDRPSRGGYGSSSGYRYGQPQGPRDDVVEPLRERRPLNLSRRSVDSIDSKTGSKVGSKVADSRAPGVASRLDPFGGARAVDTSRKMRDGREEAEREKDASATVGQAQQPRADSGSGNGSGSGSDSSSAGSDSDSDSDSSSDSDSDTGRSKWLLESAPVPLGTRRGCSSLLRIRQSAQNDCSRSLFERAGLCDTVLCTNKIEARWRNRRQQLDIYIYIYIYMYTHYTYIYIYYMLSKELRIQELLPDTSGQVRTRPDTYAEPHWGRWGGQNIGLEREVYTKVYVLSKICIRK